MIIMVVVSWAENQHIRITSEGSWDTENWSNDAENSDLPALKKHLFFINMKIQPEFQNVGMFFKFE